MQLTDNIRVNRRIFGQKFDRPRLLVDPSMGDNLEVFPLVSFSRTGPKWYFDKDGILQEAASNSLPISYHPGKNRRGWLLEESNINEVLHSRDFSQTEWNNSSNGSATRDQVGIDGQANAASLLEDDNPSSAEYLRQVVTIPDDSNTHVFSFFLKKDNDESRFVGFHLFLRQGTTTVWENQQINTKTGATDPVVNQGQTIVEDYGGWWRVSVICTNNSSGNTDADMRIYPARSSDLADHTVNTTGTCIVDCAQLELNTPKASSPIITTTAPVTRNGDIASISDLSWLNLSVGAIVSRFYPVKKLANNERIWALDDGSTTNRLHIDMSASNIRTFAADSATNLQQNAAWSDDLIRHVSFYRASDDAIKSCVDGGPVASDIQNLDLNLFTHFRIGNLANTGVWIANAFIQSIRYYDKDFTDQQLQILSAQ